MSADYAFLLGVALSGIGGLILGYWLHQSYRRDLAAAATNHAAEVAKIREAHKATAVKFYETAATLERTEIELAKTRNDLGWERLMVAVTESQRDMYSTALRGLLTHQAKCDLTEPDEPAGVADIYEFPTARPNGSAS